MPALPPPSDPRAHGAPGSTFTCCCGAYRPAGTFSTVRAFERSAQEMTGPFVYASSLAIDVEKMQRLPDADTIADETRIVLERISARLQRAGLTLRDVVKTTCYIR